MNWQFEKYQMIHLVWGIYDPENIINLHLFLFGWKDLTSDISGYKVRIKKLRENKIILEKDIPSVGKSLKMSGLLPAISTWVSETK